MGTLGENEKEVEKKPNNIDESTRGIEGTKEYREVRETPEYAQGVLSEKLYKINERTKIGTSIGGESEIPPPADDIPF
jgi:hypothetical protein